MSSGAWSPEKVQLDHKTRMRARQQKLQPPKVNAPLYSTPAAGTPLSTTAAPGWPDRGDDSAPRCPRRRRQRERALARLPQAPKSPSPPPDHPQDGPDAPPARDAARSAAASSPPHTHAAAQRGRLSVVRWIAVPHGPGEPHLSPWSTQARSSPSGPATNDHQLSRPPLTSY